MWFANSDAKILHFAHICKKKGEKNNFSPFCVKKLPFWFTAR